MFFYTLSMVTEGSFIVVMFLFYLLQHFTSSTTESESKTRGKQAKGYIQSKWILWVHTTIFVITDAEKNSNTQTIGCQWLVQNLYNISVFSRTEKKHSTIPVCMIELKINGSSLWWMFPKFSLNERYKNLLWSNRYSCNL